ncbi:MAG: hypothetical protein N5P05_003738 [Chroococcopsis gigantea SAG 12.99]|jgi:hypothetical protein|nr:hypothetical protein [Chroococcopsis gigantea SAG 12.99]
MLNKSSGWILLGLIPGFGGLAIMYAGSLVNRRNWILTGLSFTLLSLLLGTQGLGTVIWLSQVGMTLYVYQKAGRLSLDNSKLQDRLAPLIATKKGMKIDINTSSKHDLVYELGLPIVYANNIESLVNDGYMFTHLEELVEIAGLPSNYLPKISPYVVFSYDVSKEHDLSWRRINSYSAEDLMILGLAGNVATKLIAEREKNGDYQSVIDIKNRTGIPIRNYQQII